MGDGAARSVEIELLSRCLTFDNGEEEARWVRIEDVWLPVRACLSCSPLPCSCCSFPTDWSRPRCGLCLTLWKMDIRRLGLLDDEKAPSLAEVLRPVVEKLNAVMLLNEPGAPVEGRPRNPDVRGLTGIDGVAERSMVSAYTHSRV